MGDNPALQEAAGRGAVIPVFIYAPEEETPWEPGEASKWWLHQSLSALRNQLLRMGSELVVRRGTTLEVLSQLLQETGAKRVYWNRRYEPAVTSRDAKIKETLRTMGIEAESFNGSLLHEPWTIKNQSGAPFRVFTAYWRNCLTKADPIEPLPRPNNLKKPESWPVTVSLNDLNLEPKQNWAGGLRSSWEPGELGAASAVKQFLAEGFQEYSNRRDRPDVRGTSHLSPHLHFGEISPRQIWHAARNSCVKKNANSDWRNSQFITELGWREFGHHLLYHFPGTTDEPLRIEFKNFPWRRDSDFLKAWQKGQTGYPIVDAGMRELWSTGWMHNRGRMIVASFLVKDLLQPWQEGARWFWNTLVDADLAQNSLGWQWTAGCGADASPYFRIFNPVLQGQKFDPNGSYVRRWCPELANLPNQWLHQPWEAPARVLTEAGLEVGKTYPLPLVNHKIAREVAMEAYGRMKNGA